MRLCWALSLVALSAAQRYSCNSSEASGIPPSQRFGLGTNFGGWLVLEPWYLCNLPSVCLFLLLITHEYLARITPSLFYQFLEPTEVRAMYPKQLLESFSFRNGGQRQSITWAWTATRSAPPSEARRQISNYAVIGEPG
jgi:hypothetical protein